MSRHLARKSRFDLRRSRFDSGTTDIVATALQGASDDVTVQPQDHVIEALRRLLQITDGLKDTLEASLKSALAKAQRQSLHVYDPMNPSPKLWPQTSEEYLSYFLPWFVRWIPHESDVTLHNLEVYNMLCHFYWLVQEVQNVPVFSLWMVDYADAWGSFLDTPESAAGLHTFYNTESYHVSDSLIDGRPNAPSGWLTFNQFFARELNPGLRPVASPLDPTVLVSPADCTWKQTFAITEDLEVVTKHAFRYSIAELLDGSEYADAFKGGLFTHAMLGPGDYHHFGCPVAGPVLECRAIDGAVYLDVCIVDGQYEAPDSADGGYEFRQSRGLIVLDGGDVGKVAVLPIGMAQVSSVNMTAGQAAAEGRYLAKGERFGYFMFGGSDIIMLFEKKANATVFQEKQRCLLGEKCGSARLS